MKTCFIGIPLIWLAAIINGQNLAVNPGMEVWEKVTRPAGWTHVEKCTKDSTEVHSGRYSCLHTGGTTTSDLGQNISVASGKDYTLSFYYMTGALTAGKGSRIWCYWKDLNGVNLTDPATDELMRPSTYLKAAVWEKFTLTVKAPENAAVFYLEVRTNTSSSMYWDDFEFSETTTVNIGNTENSEPYLFPVPARNFITVRNINEAESIEIIDPRGFRLVYAEVRGMEDITLPVEEFEAGMYFLIIRSKSRYKVLRFIRE